MLYDVSLAQAVGVYSNCMFLGKCCVCVGGHGPQWLKGLLGRISRSSARNHSRQQ